MASGVPSQEHRLSRVRSSPLLMARAIFRGRDTLASSHQFQLPLQDHCTTMSICYSPYYQVCSSRGLQLQHACCTLPLLPGVLSSPLAAHLPSSQLFLASLCHCCQGYPPPPWPRILVLRCPPCILHLALAFGTTTTTLTTTELTPRPLQLLQQLLTKGPGQVLFVITPLVRWSSLSGVPTIWLSHFHQSSPPCSSLYSLAVYLAARPFGSILVIGGCFHFTASSSSSVFDHLLLTPSTLLSLPGRCLPWPSALLAVWSSPFFLLIFHVFSIIIVLGSRPPCSSTSLTLSRLHQCLLPPGLVNWSGSSGLSVSVPCCAFNLPRSLPCSVWFNLWLDSQNYYKKKKLKHLGSVLSLPARHSCSFFVPLGSVALFRWCWLCFTRLVSRVCCHAFVCYHGFLLLPHRCSYREYLVVTLNQ